MTQNKIKNTSSPNTPKPTSQQLQQQDSSYVTFNNTHKKKRKNLKKEKSNIELITK